MNYKKSARDVLEQIGGKENIVSAAHCATRLRLVIADNTKMDIKKVEMIDGVKGVFEAAGQIQIIFGTGTVNKVYDEFIALAGITGADKEEVKQVAAKNQNFFKRAVKTLGDIFVPIIPAIVASGLLMGILEGFCNLWPQMAESGTYTIFHLFSNAAFVYLPILIAISAAKTFGGNVFLGAVMGMIMIHSDLINAWSVSGMSVAEIPSASVWFGLYEVDLIGYQGHVIPVIIAVWLMSALEKKLHKIVPEIIDLFVTPLVTILVSGYLTLTIIGPVFSTVENWVLDGAVSLITLPFGIGSMIAGTCYAPTVVAGLHHMYNALEAGLLSQNGVNTWMPIATAANVAQGAAALAVAVKTKNTKTKSMALPASLSAFLGITEPAIFGVNIRYMTPFVAGCIGGACGGLVAGLFGIGASAYGITGVFGFLITTGYTIPYAVEMLVASGTAFAISWMLYREKNETATQKISEQTEDNSENIVYCPIKGEVIPLADVKDSTFAGEILGKGFAIIPEEGKVYAPFDGMVTMIFDTKHAIGLSNNQGMELLIHVGLNTVELNGNGYRVCVESEQEVKKGDLLLEFDLFGIKENGFDITTPVVVTNSADYETIYIQKNGMTDVGEKVLTLMADDSDFRKEK